MYALSTLATLSSMAVLTTAIPIERRATCSNYTIINTRGTTEPQGESVGFRTMNAKITSQLSGGTIYNTVYPAGVDQDSSSGTQDIIVQVQSTLAANPDACIILEGYSQGAAATVNALPSLTGANFDAIKAVFLIGDPEHKPGLPTNIDNNGGTTTKDAVGLEDAVTAGIPSNWFSKTLDVCIYGDGVCDTLHGVGFTPQHFQYPTDEPTQNLGANFVINNLEGS